MKSVTTPVSTVRWPLISASGRTALIWPSKASLPLETSSDSLVAWPLSVAASTEKASFKGTPFTVALPSMAKGPSNEPTVAEAVMSSARRRRLRDRVGEVHGAVHDRQPPRRHVEAGTGIARLLMRAGVRRELPVRHAVGIGFQDDGRTIEGEHADLDATLQQG